MQASTLELWRYVRDQGNAGATGRELYRRFEVQIGRVRLASRLKTLRTYGYLRHDYNGTTRVGTWFATEVLPEGERIDPHRPPASAVDDDEEDTEALFPRRRPVQGVPPGVPSSIWHLADMTASMMAQAAAKTTAKAPLAEVHP